MHDKDKMYESTFSEPQQEYKALEIYLHFKVKSFKLIREQREKVHAASLFEGTKYLLYVEIANMCKIIIVGLSHKSQC